MKKVKLDWFHWLQLVLLFSLAMIVIIDDWIEDQIPLDELTQDKIDVQLTRIFPSPQNLTDAIDAGYVDYDELSQDMKDMLEMVD